MATNAQLVSERQQAVKKLRDEWYEACKAFKASEIAGEPVLRQRELLLELHHRATAFFDTVETCIAEGGLLGARKNDYWANDMAGTAFNVLSRLPEYYAWIRSLIPVLGLAQNSFTPGPAAFSNMQSLLLVQQPANAQKIQTSFMNVGLPTNGFDHPPRESGLETWEKVSLFVIGTVFLMIMLLIALFDRSPTDLAIWIYRAVLSIAAAGFGAIIPGLFRIETKWVKATGREQAGSGPEFRKLVGRLPNADVFPNILNARGPQILISRPDPASHDLKTLRSPEHPNQRDEAGEERERGAETTLAELLAFHSFFGFLNSICFLAWDGTKRTERTVQTKREQI